MLFIQLNQQLGLLRDMLYDINDEQYKTPIMHLGNASIGEHTRHIIELLQCAVAGCQTGIVDYINRSRNLQLQNERMYAINNLEQIQNQIQLPDHTLKLYVEQIAGANELLVSTTYFREIVYNTDHAIHHLALIKVALNEMKLDIVTSEFGMAHATINYKAKMATQQ